MEALLSIDFDTLVVDAMKSCPATIRVFLDFKWGAWAVLSRASTPWTTDEVSITSTDASLKKLRKRRRLPFAQEN